ncbi:MAG: SOS response-associated peptidase [Firmicutes bacterium]|nr:SOS response-associated peptidase [Bacillota bacterium]
MCGRFYIDADAEFLLRYFRILYEPKVNVERPVVFPTQTSPVVIDYQGQRRIGPMEWGFKLPGQSKPIINSRAETVMEKRLFAEAFAKRRCIIPASGFFEWHQATNGGSKTPYKVALPDQPMMCMAGLYTKHIDEHSDVRWLFTIITREANDDMRVIHPRMPLMLDEEAMNLWLSQTPNERELKALLNFDIGKLLLSPV